MGHNGRRRKKYSIQILWIIVAVIATAGLLIGYQLSKSENNSDDTVVNAAEKVTDNMVSLTPTPEVTITQEPTNEPTVAPTQATEPTITMEPTVTVEPTKEPSLQGPYKIDDSENENNTPDENSSSVKPEQPMQEPAEESTEKPTEEPTQEVQKMVALTFDDGPYPPVTNRLLKLLEDNDAHATFFVVGNRIDTYSDTVKAEFEAGHQIGNHTFDHKNLTKLSAKNIQYEVEHSNKLINKNADVGNAYVRPPYGAKSDIVKNNINAPLIFWSVDSEDWKSKDKDKIYKEIMGTVKDGDIILMHDLYPTTADAMEMVIPELIKQGYKLVTVQELFEAKGIDAEEGKVYYNAR